jgi:hemoglobin-like flavoprotein
MRSAASDITLAALALHPPSLLQLSRSEPMTPDQIALVQTSFQKVVPIAGTAADLFYNRLFEIAPQTRPLFPTDLSEQKKKLMAMLATAVTNLHRLETILPAVKALGQRHKGYGVTVDHYTPVGAAVLWTLEQGLGPDFTPDTKTAWTAAYTALAGVMTEA